MSDKRYILKRNWKSKSGYSEELYFGLNEKGKIDCVPNKEMAKMMSKDDCECFLLFLTDQIQWEIEEVVEHNEDIKNENQKERNDEHEND